MVRETKAARAYRVGQQAAASSAAFKRREEQARRRGIALIAASVAADSIERASEFTLGEEEREVLARAIQRIINGERSGA